MPAVALEEQGPRRRLVGEGRQMRRQRRDQRPVIGIADLGPIEHEAGGAAVIEARKDGSAAHGTGSAQDYWPSMAPRHRRSKNAVSASIPLASASPADGLSSFGHIPMAASWRRTWAASGLAAAQRGPQSQCYTVVKGA